MMGWFSFCGTGFTLHGIRPAPGGRVAFTVWLSVCWLPLIPVSSWTGRYAGEVLAGYPFVEEAYLADRTRIPHEWGRLARTFAGGIVILVVAFAPAAAMLILVEGRAASPLEAALLLITAAWPALVVLGAESLKRRRMRAAAG
jgi:hypothetical protein